ncbi:MAG: hypothetical protein ACXWQE_13560 [Bdellovibrionales bacterium]
MKASFAVLISFLSFQAHAEFRQLRLGGRDAIALTNIFHDVGRSVAVSNPVTGSLINMFLDFKPRPEAFSLRCVEGMSNASPSCTLNFDPLLSAGPITVTAGEDDTIEVTISDAAIVTKIRKNLEGTEFLSEEKARRGKTPRLRLSCPLEAKTPMCKLTAAN